MLCVLAAWPRYRCRDVSRALLPLPLRCESDRSGVGVADSNVDARLVSLAMYAFASAK